MGKPVVAVIMGSKSDLPILEGAFKVFDSFGIEFIARVLSAHRTPVEAAEFAAKAEEEGIKVIICAAGMAAHLAGAVAANTVLPVIGIPISCKNTGGMDALLATVQMPSGIPVATVAIDGAANSAILAIQILALSEPSLKDKLVKAREDGKNTVLEKNKKIEEQFNI